jgi:hypothetical protein
MIKLMEAIQPYFRADYLGFHEVGFSVKHDKLVKMTYTKILEYLPRCLTNI